MAARIQAKTNAPCKEKKCVPSVTVEHIEQPLPERADEEIAWAYDICSWDTDAR
jgi:hypothetical protein